jgi:carbon storage regulator
MSGHELKQAIRVANDPKESFERQVESEKPFRPTNALGELLRPRGDIIQAPSTAARNAAMLILTRRTNESITIGHDIVVKIVCVKPGGLVQLGITAPRAIPVHRTEILARIAADAAEETHRRGAPGR